MKKNQFIIFFFLIGILSGFAQHKKKYITYKTIEGETIESVSKKFYITPHDLLKLNPDLKDDLRPNEIIIIPNKEYDSSKIIADVDQKNLTDRDIVVDNFIYHEVLSKETLYSIEKKYNVSNAELNKLNPFLILEVLKQGQILKIPLQVNEADISEKDNSLQPYLVKGKETKYSISREFGVSISYLEELNPTIKINGLQIDDVLMVPVNKETNNSDSDFMVHKVEKLETMYSLTKNFKISQEELLAANPELEDGVKEGMLIKIPIIAIENTDVFIDEIDFDKKLKIALMLPFRTKLDSLDFENDRLLNIATDFYLGSLLAIDSLKNQGLSVQVKVYDTENSEYISKKLSSRSEFDNFDAVIGPLFLKNVKAVSKSLQYKSSLIISPISTKDHSNLNNQNLVQEIPTTEHLAQEMLRYIKLEYTDQKIIVIMDEEETANVNYQRLLREVKSIASDQNIIVIKPKEGYIKPDIFKENLNEEKENWFLLMGNKKDFVKDVVQNLGVLPVENKVTLFAFKRGKGFDNTNNFLARVNFHYPSSVYLDQESDSFKDFKNRYIKINHTYPSKYAIQGFDITYDILMRLETDDELTGQGVSRRLESKFNYIENTSKGILNKGIFIIKYEGLELKVLK